MPFYHALTLGIRRLRPAADKGDQQDVGRRTSPEAWREGLGLAAVEYEEYPAARVLEDFRRAAAAGQARRPGSYWANRGPGRVLSYRGGSTLGQPNCWNRGLAVLVL